MPHNSLKAPPIRCAVVGLGVGEQHARAIVEHNAAELKYICDLNKDKILDVLRRLSSSVTAASFEDILRDSSINLVSIASFDDAHYQQIVDCIAVNKNVFVEKPLCQTKTQLMAIRQLLCKSQLGLASNLVLRKAPLFVWLENLIESNELGEIYAFEGDYLYGRVHKLTDGWRKEVENYSVMEGGGIHIVDLMIMLTKQKPLKVQSYCNKIATRSADFKYPDFHCAIFQFESGLVGKINANFGCVHPHQHVLRIFGTQGTFLYDDMGPRIHWKRSEANIAEKIQLKGKPLHKGVLLTEFIDSLSNAEISTSAEREFDLMSVILAADEALQYESPIPIEYV